MKSSRSVPMDLRPALFFLLLAVCGLVAAATIAVTGNDSP